MLGNVCKWKHHKFLIQKIISEYVSGRLKQEFSFFQQVLNLRILLYM